MRRGLALGLLALGLCVMHVAAASAQTPPTTPTTAKTAASTEPTATTRVLATQQGATTGITAGGEGFPWIPVGVGILVAGLIGGRLRRASRR